MTAESGRVPIDPQRVDAPLTQDAIFLVLTVTDAPGAIDRIRDTLGSVADLTKNVSFRDLGAAFAVTVGIGSAIWDRVFPGWRPKELHPFQEIRGAVHTAPLTAGDLLFHIRADRRDLCFEFERQLLDRFGDSVTVADETVGFRYFDARDLLGFVDGTANPDGDDLADSTIVADEDPDAAGGSYVVVQKYLHDLDAWNGLTAEQQEAVIGRTKPDNIELDDAAADAQKSHKTLTTIEDADGEHDILRDNMPFGSPGAKEFGTYFIGYSRRLWVTERMLQRMFVGEPAGAHDHILDFSTAVTGSTFFVPARHRLDELSD
jgi:putative iron-dependent peroxidase